MSLANSGTSPRTRAKAAAAAKKKKKVASSVTAPKPKKGLIAQAQGKPEITRAAVAARSRAAGYRPTAAAIEKTYQRDLLRVQKRLAYSSLSTKGEINAEMAAIAARGKKRNGGKAISRASVLLRYNRAKTGVQSAMKNDMAGIAARSKAKGKNPTAAAITKTYYNNAEHAYANKRSAAIAKLSSGASRWDAILHPRNPKGSIAGGKFRSTGRKRGGTVTHHVTNRNGAVKSFLKGKRP